MSRHRLPPWRPLVLAFISLFCLGLTPAQQKQLEMKITIEGRPEHPIVYMTRADIARARANRDKHEWAKKAAAKLLAEADEWVKKSDEDLVKLIPPPNACYAYGFAGCPVCGGTLASWWGQGGVATLYDPGHIKCVNGHRLPDEAHPDSGAGWTDPSGKKFYFVGTYHSYVIDTLTTATTKLVHAYALTEDESYANKAALILDHLARIYPTSETGSWDYPSNPPSGRFNRPWYQVARTLVYYVNQYDILLMGGALNAPSSTPGMTRRQNIEQTMLLNGADYCYRQSVIRPALHNGQADYIRGPMAVAAAMGIPQYIAWGAAGPYSIRAMIANNVDRDGQYYETSALYSDHARYLYMDIAEILANYTDAAHPDGIRLADDPVFRMFNLLPRTRLRAAAHPPNLGDDPPNLDRIATMQRADPRDILILEHLRALARDAECDATLLAACDGDVEAARGASKAGEWLLFHADDVGRAPAPLPQIAGAASDFFSQKGLAILRSGVGEDARAVTVRFGPTLNHGHLDEMNLNLHARGYDMSYDLGYSLGSTHTQVGWARQTASHNLVMIDESPQLQSGRAGGALKSFVALPGVSVVRADNTACYEAQQVKQYERTVALIDVSPQLSYIVDIFRVRGGKQHDYIFHARGTDVQVEGVELSERRNGSLGGEDVTWGERIGGDGNVIDVVGREYWNPPPGNGFGFLMNPRTARTRDQWSATWTIDDDAKNRARLRLTMLGDRDGRDVVRCDALGIYPKMPKAGYVLDRRVAGDDGSTFAAVIEPYGDRRAVKSISSQPDSETNSLRIKIELMDGRTDYVLWTDDQLAVIRCDDAGPAEVTVAGAGKFEFADLAGDVPAQQSHALVTVDHEKNILYTDAKLDADRLVNEWLLVDNPAYAQPSAYRIQSIQQTDDGRTAIQLHPTRLLLGRGHIDTAPEGKTLPNIVPLEYAKSVAHKPSGFFRGKRIATPAGEASARIETIDGQGMAITIAAADGFKAGDDLIIYDVWAGDTIRIVPWLSGRRTAGQRWETRSNVAGAGVIAAGD